MSGLASIFDPANAEKFKRVDRPVVVSRPRRPKPELVEDEDEEIGAILNSKKRSRGDLDVDESEKKKKPKHEKRKLLALSKKKADQGEDALDAVEKSFIATSRKQRPASEPEEMEVEEPNLAAEVVAEDPSGEKDNEKNERTLFAGNIPVSFNAKQLKVYFKEFGAVESVRLRSVPYEGTAVDQHGNQDLVRKVAVNSGKVGSQKGSLNAYIVFEQRESVTAALAANNRMIGDRHLRVDRSTPTLFDPKSTIFIGGLPYYADEEKLREHFAAVLPNGQEDIVSVRIVRDPTNLVCKGIGYILLSGTDAVFKALTLNKAPFKKRELRVSTCGKRTKRSEPKKADPVAGGDANGAVEPRKRPKKQKELKGAAKRIDAKVKAKRDILGKKKNKKNSKPKKAKQLGGVIKRVIKLTKQQNKI